MAVLNDEVDRTARLLAEQDLVREGLLINDEPERSPRLSPKLRITPIGTQLLDFVRFMTDEEEPPP